MKFFDTVEAVLDFAINDEAEAARLYRVLADKMDSPRLKKVFEDFAREEEGHKAKLIEVKKGKFVFTEGKKVQDLKIAEQLQDVPPTDQLDYQQALILAMKAEKAAFRLYSELAEAAKKEDVRKIFEGLAREEANHKLRFEVEYESHFMDESQDWKAHEKQIIKTSS